MSGRKAGLSYVYFSFPLLSIAPRRLTMSFPYSPKLQDEKLESLHTQFEFLNLLRLRHLQWMTSASDHEIEAHHLEVAELIAQITDHYNHLLGVLPEHIHMK
jgi:hypothetical protein